MYSVSEPRQPSGTSPKGPGDELQLANDLLGAAFSKGALTFVQPRLSELGDAKVWTGVAALNTDHRWVGQS